MGTYEITRNRNGLFKWSLKAGNGEVVLASQMYKSKASAQKGIASTMLNSAHPDRFERKTARNNKPFFVLKALNGQQVGKSQLYESERARDNGIRSVAKNGPNSTIKDLS